MAGNRALVVIVAVTTAVLVAALSSAMVLRAQRAHQRAAATTATTSSTPAGRVVCDPQPCLSLASATVGTGGSGTTTVQLFAGPAGDGRSDHGVGGRLRFEAPGGTSIFELDISDEHVLFSAGSLDCVSGSKPVCLVFGVYPPGGDQRGALGEVFEQQDGWWTLLGGFFRSSAGSLALDDAGGSTEPTVIAVQNDCGGTTDGCQRPRVYVQLFSLADTSLGCTRTASAVHLLPGGGTSAPPASDLHPCSSDG